MEIKLPVYTGLSGLSNWFVLPRPYDLGYEILAFQARIKIFVILVVICYTFIKGWWAMKSKRNYPIGAEYSKEGTSFRVWAPDHKKVTLVLENKSKKINNIALKKEMNGYFSVFVPGLEQDTHYYFKLDNKDQLLSDPASRYQPLGVEGPSGIVNSHFDWTDTKWPGVELDGQIMYELHFGTFTQEGTFKAAAEKLGYLAELGITLIELMPINEFPGHFGWGYDGIHLFAPYHSYGSTSEIKAFINKAHKLNLGVILDVVYNHFGPEGNHFSKFSKEYFNPNEKTEWGEAINFNHPSAREYFLTNARYWIEEFHFDGLRIDATPWFFSQTPIHILKELSQVIKKANPKKKKIIIGESETQDIQLLQPYKSGGYQFDALWNDDFHHTACVRLKGKREAYYTDYLGSPQEFISALKYGFLYQGQYYSWQDKERGKFDLQLPYSSMIVFLENHDQIANTGHSKRLYQLCDFGNFKALTCLLLLGPNTPMIFQGQEFGSTAPFYYFADHTEDLNELINTGRKEFLSQFPSLATKEAHRNLKKPFDPLTFTRCKLDFTEKENNSEHFALYKDLIQLRKQDPVFKSMKKIRIDGAVLDTNAFLIRYFGEELGDRLLIINFGPNLTYNPAPEPLIVAGNGLQWEVIWSSESFEYGGEGMPPIFNPYIILPGHSAIVLKPKKRIAK
jgi:maltooligosyltrehalose trehalohydrolase